MADLKLGLKTGYWAGGPPPGMQETILEAERLGCDSIWTAEAYGSDCPTPLARRGARPAGDAGGDPRGRATRLRLDLDRRGVRLGLPDAARLVGCTDRADTTGHGDR